MSDTYSPLVTQVWPEKFGGNGFVGLSAKKFIVLHGTTNLKLEQTRHMWYSDKNRGGRQASANYVVHEKEIAGAVGEEWSAWHCGGVGKITNQNSIGVEFTNSTIGDWSTGRGFFFSDQTIETGCQLIADICKRLGIVPSKETIVPHRAVYGTACPQEMNVDYVIKRIQEIYNGKGSKQEKKQYKGEDYMLFYSNKYGYGFVSGGKMVGLSSQDSVNGIKKSGCPEAVITDKDFLEMSKSFK